ncbi:hypothetical protein [Jiangella muralis]|uniref:hypothetical protein n=1 Tax=Jiangella muralis TaxID=702383 RepID=UPI00069DF34D|nr:hypothetical protein [Jiangella muralis]
MDRGLGARRSELRWPGLRSVYCWHPPTGDVTVSGEQQIGVTFAEHHGVVTESDGRCDRFDSRPGDVFANGRSRVFWSELTRPDELVEIHPGHGPGPASSPAGSPSTSSGTTRASRRRGGRSPGGWTAYCWTASPTSSRSAWATRSPSTTSPPPRR